MSDSPSRAPSREASEATPSVELSRLSIGESAVVQEVAGERHLRCRLLEMGLVPGTTVTITRVAPLGDPVELEVRGSALSVRRAEASGVRVTRRAGTR